METRTSSRPASRIREGLNQDDSGSPEPAMPAAGSSRISHPRNLKNNGQDEKNQTAPGEEAEQRDQAQPSAAGNEDSGQQAASAQADAAAQTMSREEAEQLLQAMQSEEGRLHLYIPSQETTENATRKDW